LVVRRLGKLHEAGPAGIKGEFPAAPGVGYRVYVAVDACVGDAYPVIHQVTFACSGLGGVYTQRCIVAAGDVRVTIPHPTPCRRRRAELYICPGHQRRPCVQHDAVRLARTRISLFLSRLPAVDVRLKSDGAVPCSLSLQRMNNPAPADGCSRRRYCQLHRAAVHSGDEPLG